MVIGNPDVGTATNNAGGGVGVGVNNVAHPSGIPQDQIDNIMSGIANTGDVKMNNHRKKLRQRFDIIKKLGQGTYGKVQLGINKETGQEVAIKTIKKCKIEAEADLVRIRREVQIMSSVQHPNIIHIYEVFENREKMVLVMEFAAGGELYDYLSERKVLSEEEAKRIFRQVATAVYYCHKHKICHRDLKLENILLDEQGNAKIADFGLSNVFDDQRLLATFCGSPLYASPEIVEGTPYQGPEVDCWSLGVLLYTLVYGSMPFDGSNFKRLVKQISQGDYYEPKKPSRASSLIRDMLTVCPRKRATIEQICSHWWVNENDNLSCLDLAEDLANQTPVRLDVLLSLTPTAITADQLVVPSADGGAGMGGERMPRSHSVGSIRDMGANTEAERRIMDMVAAGGEAALMPSPTRTITPAQSPIQSKRKLQTTVSMENAAGAHKKKEKPGSSTIITDESTTPLTEETPMETEDAIIEEPITPAPKANASQIFSQQDMQLVGDICEQLIQEDDPSAMPAPAPAPAAAPPTENVAAPTTAPTPATVPRQRTVGKLDAVQETPEEKDATKVIKKFVNKQKTAELVNAIGQNVPEKPHKQVLAVKPASMTTPVPFVRKCSLQDESSLNKFNTDRRKSRILETAEKFQQMNAAGNGGGGADKTKKVVIPGISVGSYKKEFERKAAPPTAQVQGPTAGERRAMEQVAAAAAAAQDSSAESNEIAQDIPAAMTNLEKSDSKNLGTSQFLEEARRSMENSIALLRQAQSESSKEVDQLCAKTENIDVSDPVPSNERERKLKNARTIIGNAIQPVIRRPQPVFGIGGGGYGRMRAISSSSIGYGAGDGNYGGAITINYTPTPAQQSPPSPSPLPSSMRQTIMSPQRVSPHTNVALAAARQKIMRRLAAGGHNIVFHPNSLSTSFISNSLHNSISPTQQLQYQHQQQQLQRQQQQQKFLQQQRHHQQPPPPYLHQREQEQEQQQRQQQQQQQQQQIVQQHQNQYHHMPIAPQSSSYYDAFAYAHAHAPAVTAAKATTNIATINSVPKPFYNASPSILFKSSPGGDPNAGAVKTSTASITLKSATLPRRKTAKTEIQLEIKPRIVEKPAMRFTTEMQHPVADLRSAPAREGPLPYSPIKTVVGARATSLEPKEHIIQIQRPQTAYARTTSNTTTRSDSLSRQSTGDSESDTTTTNMSQSTITGSSQPIKKSPREFIIPIAMEGGGFITPREGSIEPSESSHTTSSRTTFSRLRPTRRIGSLLNDTGDDNSPFQKMRTASSNRDVDDDTHFTLHKLRSSRPVKKLSQDNDSQSSGEEDDDDDGFEILTAENLFSTLLQRVRALTNRMNVNNDLTAGFPNSTRLLSNMRQSQSPFWNQEPFGSRLNNTTGNNMGAPWRHSMSRDLGTGMDTMFSRTGATLPRGNKAGKSNFHFTLDAGDGGGGPTRKTQSNDIDQQSRVGVAATEEPLDLADLDLSRLRLSKKDLETLSSIAPGLPKCFQEQLLAKLPPTQARKLSRTLSLQNSPQQVPTLKVYKRSQSGGRGLEATTPTVPVCNDLKQQALAEETVSSAVSTAHITMADEKLPNPSYIHRRSVSRSRYDCDSNIPSPADATASVKNRSNSVCRDDYGKSSLCSSYTSDINDKYKYYSPYLSKTQKDSSSTESGSVSPYKRYGSISPRDPTIAAMGRPPSGCLSPPPSIAADGGSGSLRRRSTQRRISRFLRPDFFEEHLEENPHASERVDKEDAADIMQRKHSLPDQQIDGELKLGAKHVRNKSMEAYSEHQDSAISLEAMKRSRRSLSRPRDIADGMDKRELADKILQELQLLSAVRSQQEKRLSVPREISIERTPPDIATTSDTVQSNDAHNDDNGFIKQKTSTIKKVKKVKPKEKSAESSTDADNTRITTTVVLKKVKRVVKKNDNNKTLASEDPSTTISSTATEDECKETCNADTHVLDQSKKESKLKRPKSYPTKESTPTAILKPEMSTKATKPQTIPENSGDTLNSSPGCNNINEALVLGSAKESRLVRPKSYPASKLTPPKDVRKITRSGIAMPSNTETVDIPIAEDKHPSSMLLKNNTSDNTTSLNEIRPAGGVVTKIKVTKKSKLAQPSTPNTPTTPTAAFKCDDNTESTPSSSPKSLKEKSPEKKPNKGGLLYAIGQKFEKLRDSAMNKDKKLAGSTSSTLPTNVSSKKSSSGSSSPEKQKDKSTILIKKKKSSDNNTPLKTDKIANCSINDIECKSSKTSPNYSEGAEKPAKTEKRSRIDAMIRSLRDRSVPPRTDTTTTETNFIKRAVSVEEMPPSSFNKNAVNKVLGLFKRFEKDNGGNNRRVQSTRSTSNIERHIREVSPPSSPIYQNTIKANVSSSAALAAVAAKPSNKPMKTSTKTSKTNKADINHGEINCNCEQSHPPPTISVQKVACPDCLHDQVNNLRSINTMTTDSTAATTHQSTAEPTQSALSNKDKRKGLKLDLGKLEKVDGNTSTNRSLKNSYLNGNGIYSNLPPYPGMLNTSSNNSSSQQSMDNAANNNNSYMMTNNNGSSMHHITSQTSGYRSTSSANEINRNHILATPSSENVANYSSDCASTSTFLSPTDEPELYFDNWSICSEDNYMLQGATPSPTVSRLSRTSQVSSSPTRCESSGDTNESVIDRIKRRSFYSRFNEKKPKRTSSIVGPSAVRDYYREQKAAIKKAGSSSSSSTQRLNVVGEREKSPDIMQQFLRPLKLSPVGAELRKPPIYKAPLGDYSSSTLNVKPRKSLNDIRTSSSPSFLSKRYYGTSTDNDYLSINSAVPIRFKSSSSSSPYESNGGGASAGAGTNYYSTYNPKRRSSYTLNGTLPSGISSNIDGYATVGRHHRTIRPYDQRTMSMLDPTMTSTSIGSTSGYHRDIRSTPVRDYSNSGISRSNSRYRTSSVSRSPTNI